MDKKHHIQTTKWDLLVCHPPCTYLTNAGARWLLAGGILNKERYKQGQEAKEFFMKFYNADCEKIVIENPVPSAVFELPQYTQIIEPYMFGHPVTKKTCLWIKGLSPLKETNNVGKPSYEHTRYTQKSGKTRTVCWEMAQKGGSKIACERSKTFPGIALAMAEQWG
ncbi:MAG: DNA cytosine methyltransferase [Oscillospiraceae bacterium]